MAEWLDKNQYRRIRAKAKKMGAKDICLTAIAHYVRFEYSTVSFMFKPFVCVSNFSSRPVWPPYSKSAFSTQEDIEAIKADMEKALAFMEYLKEFNKEVEQC